MEGFSLITRATIEIAIKDFGTERDKAIWEGWSKEYPDTRTNPQQPDPHSKISIRVDVKETIIICLRRNYEYASQQTRSPLNTQDDIAYFTSKMSRLYAIGRRLSPTHLEWPTGY